MCTVHTPYTAYTAHTAHHNVMSHTQVSRRGSVPLFSNASLPYHEGVDARTRPIGENELGEYGGVGGGLTGAPDPPLGGLEARCVDVKGVCGRVVADGRGGGRNVCINLY